MKAGIFATIAVSAMLISPCYADDARPHYNWMKGLEGEWVLSPADKQEGKHLATTYTSWKDGKYLKDSVYHFDRK